MVAALFLPNRYSKKPSVTSAKTPTGTPTPMPTFAPVDRPWDCPAVPAVADCEGDAGVECDEGDVLDGEDKVDEVVGISPEVYATVIGATWMTTEVTKTTLVVLVTLLVLK